MKYTSVVLVCIMFVVLSLMITDFFYCMIITDKMINRQCLRIVFLCSDMALGANYALRESTAFNFLYFPNIVELVAAG